MTKTIAAGAFALFVAAASLRAASLDSTALGQAKPCAHTVEAGRPADLGVRGRSAEIKVEYTLEPGGPVAVWTTANQAAREKDERLPDTLTVARLVQAATLCAAVTDPSPEGLPSSIEVPVTYDHPFVARTEGYAERFRDIDQTKPVDWAIDPETAAHLQNTA
jgi:hypothetical protein